MSTQLPAVPATPAGWYADPWAGASADHLRWFDGAAWTGWTHVVTAPAPAAAVAEATVVTVVRRSPNHAFHLVMTICTGGAWLPVWIIAAVFGRGSKVVTRTTRV